MQTKRQCLILIGIMLQEGLSQDLFLVPSSNVESKNNVTAPSAPTKALRASVQSQSGIAPIIIAAAGVLGSAALSAIGGAVAEAGMSWITGKEDEATKVEKLVVSVTKLDSTVQGVQESIESLGNLLEATNVNLKSIVTTLDTIAQTLQAIYAKYQMEAFQEAYDYITRKFTHFATCFKSASCLERGPGSLYELCYEDKSCENDIVDSLDKHLGTIHAYLIGASNPLSHMDQVQLIDIAYKSFLDSDNVGVKECFLNGCTDVQCEIGSSVAMLSYMTQAALVQFQGFSMYASILQRWGYNNRVTTQINEFQNRLVQQYSLADSKFSSGHMTTGLHRFVMILKTYEDMYPDHNRPIDQSSGCIEGGIIPGTLETMSYGFAGLNGGDNLCSNMKCRCEQCIDEHKIR